MRVVIVCGNNSNQKALAYKVSSNFNVVGIVVESKKQKNKYFTFKDKFIRIWERFKYFKIHNAWKNLMNHYQSIYPSFNNKNIKFVENINDKSVVPFIKHLEPDTIIVSGTRMIKAPFFEIKPKKGVLNLHTGISPYIKGGPNCTNWCISENKFHFIGNTVMWIDEGIDTGNIITTEQTPLRGNESLFQIHLKVMDHAHDLYLRSIEVVRNNFENCPSVCQKSIGKGKIYYTNMWRSSQKKLLLKNFKNFNDSMNSLKYIERSSKLTLVKLPSNKNSK